MFAVGTLLFWANIFQEQRIADKFLFQKQIVERWDNLAAALLALIQGLFYFRQDLQD